MKTVADVLREMREAEESRRRDGPAPARVRFQHWECEVELHRYGNGRPALLLVAAADREAIATATVNLPAEPLGRADVFVKDWSENAGMLRVLGAGGIVRATGEFGGEMGAPKAEIVHPVLMARLREPTAQARPDRDRGFER